MTNARRCRLQRDGDGLGKLTEALQINVAEVTPEVDYGRGAARTADAFCVEVWIRLISLSRTHQLVAALWSSLSIEKIVAGGRVRTFLVQPADALGVLTFHHGTLTSEQANPNSRHCRNLTPAPHLCAQQGKIEHGIRANRYLD